MLSGRRRHATGTPQARECGRRYPVRGDRRGRQGYGAGRGGVPGWGLADRMGLAAVAVGEGQPAGSAEGSEVAANREGTLTSGRGKALSAAAQADKQRVSEREKERKREREREKERDNVNEKEGWRRCRERNGVKRDKVRPIEREREIK